MCSSSTYSALEKNLSAAASSTKPSDTLSVFIQSPERGSCLTRPGSNASSTNGVAIVSPNTAMPSVARHVSPDCTAGTSNSATTGAVHVNELITSVAPIINTPTMPPALRVLPAASIRKRGGCSTNTPSSERPNTTNAVPMTVLVIHCAANGTMCWPSCPASAPITVNIATMPKPYASASDSTLPPRASACLVKKLNVIGIIGYVHGITRANRPPPMHARINAHSELSSPSLDAAGCEVVALLARAAPASTATSNVNATDFGISQPFSSQTW